MILFVLLALDYVWIIVFNGAQSSEFLSPCLDSTQWALLMYLLTYFILTIDTIIWYKKHKENNYQSKHLINKKLVKQKLFYFIILKIFK